MHTDARISNLCLIVFKMSAMDLTAVAPEMLNGDVQSFIVHKRASLPKPALQKVNQHRLISVELRKLFV